MSWFRHAAHQHGRDYCSYVNVGHSTDANSERVSFTMYDKFKRDGSRDCSPIIMPSLHRFKGLINRQGREVCLDRILLDSTSGTLCSTISALPQQEQIPAEQYVDARLKLHMHQAPLKCLQV